MLTELFACETKNPDRGHGGPKNNLVMIPPLQLWDTREFAAQWEQSQVHSIDTNAFAYSMWDYSRGSVGKCETFSLWSCFGLGFCLASYDRSVLSHLKLKLKNTQGEKWSQL